MPPDQDWVYWAELPRRHDQTALLYAAPLNVADILREQLFSPLRTVVLTSATLTVAGRFHYYLRKVGLTDRENVRSLKLGSPFDFSRQMRLGLPAFLPSPRQPEYEERMAGMLRDLVKRIPRGTLGLFTSHRALKIAGKALDREIPSRSLLVQGAGGSRDQLLRRFRDEPGSVLLGTDSFWEGIDVVGEALELLLVTKLPFEVPSEPLVEARLERLAAEGKDPFLYYTVPEAIIRLRQGIGRLIRSRTDRGAALVCDARLTQSRYGRAFLDSLPVPVTVYETYDDMIRDLEAFFAPEEVVKKAGDDS
jgi:ATP-dependent DNA helicase DinG